VVIDGPAMTLIVKACDALPPPLSMTCAVKLMVLAAEGVPLIAPPLLKERPPSDPLVTVQVYPVPVPPDAVSVCEYAAVSSPWGSGEVVVIAGPAITVSVMVPDVTLVEALSVIVTVKGKLPGEVGVPLITPAELSERPSREPVASAHV
jgi:hypothetical protein